MNFYVGGFCAIVVHYPFGVHEFWTQSLCFTKCSDMWPHVLYIFSQDSPIFCLISMWCTSLSCWFTGRPVTRGNAGPSMDWPGTPTANVCPTESFLTCTKRPKNWTTSVRSHMDVLGIRWPTLLSDVYLLSLNRLDWTKPSEMSSLLSHTGCVL